MSQMNYQLDKQLFDRMLAQLAPHFDVYAPSRLAGRGTFSDTDAIRYAQVHSFEEICWDEKSQFSPKDVILPPRETMSYFTEEEYQVPAIEEKDRLVLLRSCDLHAVRVTDQIYLGNGPVDPYYKRRRDKVRFALIGCSTGFESCFCVSMGTNAAPENAYDMAFNLRGEQLEMLIHRQEIADLLDLAEARSEQDLEVDICRENQVQVRIPENLDLQEVIDLPLWKEYDSRCIACGKCNFVCPTCTCTSTQDIFYTDNGKVGERRRVWASCHVDNFSVMAGGHDFRKEYGQRMRFKVMHKISDFQKRFGYQMCIGCGRCEDACPEFISFINCVNMLNDTVSENRKIAEQKAQASASQSN